jgi:hypothetical protein
MSIVFIVNFLLPLLVDAGQKLNYMNLSFDFPYFSNKLLDQLIVKTHLLKRHIEDECIRMTNNPDGF